MDTNLENLSALVAEHRRDKKRGKFPPAVWESVIALRKSHTVGEIARTSGLDATQIYRCTGERRRSFFREVKVIAPPSTVKPVVMELRRSDGAELRLRLEANREELSAIFVSFLQP